MTIIIIFWIIYLLGLFLNYIDPLVADLCLFCYERDSVLSLSERNQANVIEAFNSTSRYLYDLHNTN